MATVADLKQKARSLEQEGNAPKALAIYKHILAHLEGTPAIKQELPLYVKVGDLLLKQGDEEAAVSMYERAGRHYAEHGSPKSILALCNKVLRVDPKRTSVYFKFSRMMLDREHVLPAREVLIDYVGRMNLDKAKAVLERLADRPADEVRPVLEKLIEVGQRAKVPPSAPPLAVPEAVPEEPEPEPPAAVVPYEPEQAEPPAMEPEPEEPAEPVAEEPVAAAPEPEPPVWAQEPEAPEPVEERELADVVEEPSEPAPSMDGLPILEVEEPELETEPPSAPAQPAEVEPEYPKREEPAEPFFTPDGAEPVESWVTPEPEEEPVGVVEEEPRGYSEHHPEMARSGPLIRDQEPKKKSMLVWIGAAAGVVVIGAGAAMMLFGGGSDNGGAAPDQAPEQPAPPPAVAAGDSAQVAAAADTADTAGAFQDSAAQLLADSTALVLGDTAVPETAGLIDSVGGVPDSLGAPTTAGSLAVTQDSPTPPGTADSVADTTRAAALAPPVVPPAGVPPVAAPEPAGVVTRLPAGVTVSGPVIAVDGLEVESVTELASGYRVVQLLESGERLVLTVNAVGADSTAPAPGAARITTLGTTAVGVVRFGEFVVNARGVVAGDVLEALLESLVEISSS